MRMVNLFSIYFKNLPKLLLANLLFAVPFVLFTGLFNFLGSKLQVMSIFVALLCVVFVTPFFAGITLVTRNLVRDESVTSIVKLFFKGIKENYKKFIFHGIVLYFAVLACYFSVALYWNLSKTSGLFYLPLVLTSIITLACVFAFYYIPVMTVTLDLPLKYIYKNSFLFSFGEFKNNLFATVGLFILFLIGATTFLSVWWLLLIFIVLFLPSTASFIVNFYVYDDMMSLNESKAEKSQEIQDKIKIQNDKLHKENIENVVEKLDFSSLDLDENKDGEEFLYFNGKMLKRRVLIQMKKQQESDDE